MKKILALVLAAVLAVGTTTVAFAADEVFVPENFAIINGNTVQFEEGDKILQADLNTLWYADDGKIAGTLSQTGNIKPGETIYFAVAGGKYTGMQDMNKPILDSGMPDMNLKLFTNVSDLKDYRISYSIDDGKNMIAGAKFVKMSMTGSSKKGLFIEMKTNDNFIMEAQTVNMTIKVSAKNNAWVHNGGTNVMQNGTISDDFNRDLGYVEASVGNGYYTIDGAAILSFEDDADDVTLCFDKDVEVQGNMKGQKDVLVRMKTGNDTLEEKYPDATLRLFDSMKDTFKRDVNVMIPYESAVEMPYLYEVDSKGALTKLYGGAAAEKMAGDTAVKYDDMSGAFTFKTKTLGNYVISDTELKSISTGTDVDAPAAGDKPTDGTQPNPGTGANDFVGLAVALAVVSIAGLAVVKRK